MSTDPRIATPQHRDQPPVGEPPFDPLRLCVFATVALIAWLTGPVAVAVFAGIGFVGYLRARRGGLLASRCKLGDTRIVLAYLAVLVAAGAAGSIWALFGRHLGV
jgi:hypothetical protein